MDKISYRIGEKMKNETFLLATGLIVLTMLIYTYGLEWAIKEFSSFYVAITVFNFIKKKIDEIKKE